ncbi:unnamed protein product [Orchesella dallaii]|uniref:Uncharacterized protein n=1 Tax=Orchesella dallaii TaxID=48710 RepID=A0ABP1QDX8_9HEXA
MTSRNSSGRVGNDLSNTLRLQHERLPWCIHPSSTLAIMHSDVNTFKKRNGSSSSSEAVSDAPLSDETCDSMSDEDPSYLGTVPKLSLPTLYEDEENPVTVKINCRKCLDMEVILRNFTEIHVKAFATCREKRDHFWEYMTHWNDKLQKKLETAKSHLVGEFISHIQHAPLSEFKKDHDFRVQFNHYRLLFTHLKSMENRTTHRRNEIGCPLKDNYNLVVMDKVLKDLHMKICSARGVLQQLEKRIRCIAKSWDGARAATNPHGFRQAIFTKEDYIFNRLANIFTCIEFLENEKKFYESKCNESSATKAKFLPVIQLKPRSGDNQYPKPCNVKRRPQNSVKRKLPSTIAHFYPFVKPQQMDEVHTSWYRTFLRPEDIRKEISKQRDTNMRVLTDIDQLKHDIQHLEIQIKMKEYVNENSKNGTEEINMFPEKCSTVPTFIDFNTLF